MKTRILDANALSAVTPAALRSYVVFEGWSPVERFGDSSEVYANAAYSRELIIPFTTDIADYAYAVGEAVRELSKVEGRDELTVYTDLSRADRDVLRVRAPEADDDGSIEVDQGVDIVHHARDLLASAACAAYEPRRAFHLGKIIQASEYMRRVRLGQTEHGSSLLLCSRPFPPD